MSGIAIAIIAIVAKDAPSLRPAETITAAVRVQAGDKASEYRVVASGKDSDAAAVAAECQAAEPRCAAKIGAALGAELVLAGELERRGTHHTLVLELVDVKTKQRVRSVRQTAAANSDAKKLARAAYSRLVGGDLGELAVIANAQQGEVLIDGQVVAGLFEGHTTISGLVKGPHLLSIHARGYKPLDIDVTIESATEQTLLLDPE